jgi:hypothetical protein
MLLESDLARTRITEVVDPSTAFLSPPGLDPRVQSGCPARAQACPVRAQLKTLDCLRFAGSGSSRRIETARLVNHFFTFVGQVPTMPQAMVGIRPPAGGWAAHRFPGSHGPCTMMPGTGCRRVNRTGVGLTRGPAWTPRSPPVKPGGGNDQKRRTDPRGRDSRGSASVPTGSRTAPTPAKAAGAIGRLPAARSSGSGL